MADEVSDAIAGLLRLLNQLTDIRLIYDEPPDRPAVAADRPFLMAVPTSGSWLPESSGLVRGLHSIQLGAYVSRKEGELSRAIKTTLPLGDLLKDKLLSSAIANIQWQDASGNATIDTTDGGPITYVYGPLDYAGLNLFGWTLTIPVKIKSLETSTQGIYAKG